MISRASSADEPLREVVARNVTALRTRLNDAGRGAGHVRVVAVTKTFSAAHVQAAFDVGLRHVGENYVREMVAKQSHGDVGVQWHYLGALQTNKLALVAATADLIASVARTRELDVLGKQGVRPPVYLEVDFTGEPGRNGAAPAELDALLASAQTNDVEVRGLMTVAPPDPAEAEHAFRAVTRLADQYALPERSMGMSDDLEIAVACGSTEIRVGRALFGARP
jgi:PLP dependent protein